MDEEIAYQHRYVASAQTARQLARAYVDHLFRRRQTLVLFAAVFVLLAAIFLLSMDASYALGTRIGWALALAVVPTVIFALAIAMLSYARTVKSAATRVFDGAVLESGFGTDELVLRNPVASSRIQFRAIRSIDVRGEEVFMRQHGVPLVSVFPRELFPDQQLARIRRAAADSAG